MQIVDTKTEGTQAKLRRKASKKIQISAKFVIIESSYSSEGR